MAVEDVEAALKDRALAKREHLLGRGRPEPRPRPAAARMADTNMTHIIGRCAMVSGSGLLDSLDSWTPGLFSLRVLVPITPVDFQQKFWHAPVERPHKPVTDAQSEVPYGTLDLMVLKTLNSMGSQHGYGIARRIEQMAQGSLALNQGTIYPALLRLEQKGWIAASWGTSENNRRARFYAITRAGRNSSRSRRRTGRAQCRW